MTDTIDIIKDIASHSMCSHIDCQECRELFKVDGCPSDRVDHRDVAIFIKKFIDAFESRHLWEAPIAWNDITEEEVISIVRSIK